MTIKSPFFVINPKNYLNQKELNKLAKVADDLALKYEVCLIMTAPFTALANLKKTTKNLLIAAQHVEPSEKSNHMGRISVRTLDEIGVDVVVINHVENKLYLSEIIDVVQECQERKIATIVCCDSVVEAQALSTINPTVILCEPTELIGTGVTSDLSYVKEVNAIIKNENPDILVEQAAGVKNYHDVYQIIKAGSDGTGATSAFINTSNYRALIEEMIQGVVDGFNSTINIDKL